MDDETKSAIEAIRGEIFALRTMLFSHIMTTNRSHPGVAQATIGIAESQIDAAWAADRNWEAMKLAALIDGLNSSLRPPADND